VLGPTLCDGKSPILSYPSLILTYLLDTDFPSLRDLSFGFSHDRNEQCLASFFHEVPKLKEVTLLTNA
jgi:hypothetical protein